MTELSAEQRVAFQRQLRAGCTGFGLELGEATLAALLDYLALLIKWNRAYNLSAIREPAQMVSKHLLDSLSIVAHIAADPGARYIDVGTGAGLPGLVLALCLPDRHFTLLDSAGKKTRFLFQARQALDLTNVSIENRRVESYQPAARYDGVISRAFASLADMCAGCQHLLGTGGHFWAMKGLYPQDELSALQKHYIVDACHSLQVPGEIGERCLVVLSAG